MLHLRWIFEKGVFEDEYFNRVIDTATELSYPYRIVERDKSGSYANLVKETYHYDDGPVLSYGSLALSSYIQRKTQFYPGTICELDNFKCSNYYPRYYDYLLNQDFIMLPIGSIMKKKKQLESLYPDGFFIRPDTGFKSFTGMYINKRNFDHIEIFQHNCKLSDLVLISKPKNIEAEYRFFISDSIVISGSQYMSNGRYNVTNEIPDQCREFAGFIADESNISPPMENFVLDVCKTIFGYSIVEINSISCSCWYDMDYKKVLEELNYFGLFQYEDLFMHES